MKRDEKPQALCRDITDNTLLDKANDDPKEGYEAVAIIDYVMNLPKENCKY